MCCVLIISVGVTSVRVADRLIIFPYQLAHFLGSQLADYCTYNMVDLLLYLSILVSATIPNITNFRASFLFFPFNFSLPDPDPGGKMNANPDPQTCLRYTVQDVVNKYKF